MECMAGESCLLGPSWPDKVRAWAGFQVDSFDRPTRKP